MFNGKWIQWIGLLGSALSIAGFAAAMITSPPIGVTVGILVLLAISLAFLAIYIVHLLDTFKHHTNAVDVMVKNFNRFIAGGALASERWLPLIYNRPFSIHDVRLKLIYHDKKGHHVRLEKTQVIMAHADNVTEIIDRGLKSDGQIDWASASTSIGTVDTGKIAKKGTMYEVPTTFQTPLPKGINTYRKFNLDLIDAFCQDREDFILSISNSTANATIIIEAAEGMEFAGVIGEIYYGHYHVAPTHLPRIADNYKTIIWEITQPQIGETFRLIWTRVLTAEHISLSPIK
jgi:hypothetical protein